MSERDRMSYVEGDEAEDVCECELPGWFYSGVPGIIARMERGRLAPGAVVERCDLCQRYPSDKAALERLRELGLVPSRPLGVAIWRLRGWLFSLRVFFRRWRAG